MKQALFNKLCCPIDKSDLNLKIINQDESGEIKEGVMTCTSCGRYYPIIYGLPIMTPDEYREKSLENPVLEKWDLDVNQLSSETFKMLDK